jgi:excisionase family DNA binding protein
MKEYLTVSEAAAALKVSERTVRRRCETGKLKAELRPTATGTAWHIEADSCGQVRPPVRTGAAIAADTVSSENQSQSPSDSADTAANSSDRFGQTAAIGAAIQPDTQRALGRLEGLALSGLEKSIAQAVENAVSLAVAPLADEIRALRLQVERLEKQGRYDAPQAPVISSGDVSPTAQKQAAQRGAQPRELTAWQRVAARILGIR